jgi:hypothetical protein
MRFHDVNIYGEHDVVTDDPRDTHPDTKGTPRISYGKVNVIPEGLSIAILQRLANISFWHVLGLALSFSLLVRLLYIVASFYESYRDEHFLNRDLALNMKQILAYLVMVISMTAIYLALVSHDEEPSIAGTFFCSTHITGIRIVQNLEGILFVAVIFAAYTIPITARQLIDLVGGDQRQQGQYRKVLFGVVKMILYPLLMVVIGWLACSFLFSSVSFIGVPKPVTLPQFGPLIIILIWYIPFVYAIFPVVQDWLLLRQIG